MNILVTGGAGYVGSVVVEELLKAGDRVVVYDNLNKGHRAAVLPDVELIVGDVADSDQLEQLLRRHQVHAVVHMAALIQVGESVASPALYYENNVGNALRLLHAMLAAGVERVVFSSTAAVYGDPDQVPIPEDAPIRPNNPYGDTKATVERVLKAYERAYGLRYASLRYFNAAGSSGNLGEDHESESHLIPLVLKVALGQRRHVQIYGTDYDTPDGTCIRDYIHVSDLAAAHVLALRALDRGSCVYNLGNGDGFSVREVIDVARAVTGHPLPCVEVDRRPGDTPRLIASSERIKRELGWNPRFAGLEAIVSSAWEWQRRHPNGYPGDEKRETRNEKRETGD